MRESGLSDPAALALNASLEARLALASGDRESARWLVEQAILFESQRPLPIRLPDHYLLLAEAEPEARERHVFAALTALENMRPLLPRNDPITEESIFSLHMRKVFEAAVEVQLASTSGDESGRIRTAQRIVEAYRQAELLNAVGSECLPPRNPVQPEDLAANEVLFYPLLLRDRIELIYVSGRDGAQGQVNYRRLPPNRTANRQEVARLVEDLVISMSYGQDEEWREPARRLYDLLIRPIEDQLGEGSTLAIIPDGPLRALPFAALVAEDGRFLVERTALSVAPALAYSQPGSTRPDAEMTVVAASLEQAVALPAGRFAALQGTGEEARIAAANGAPGRHIADFSKADLVAALSGDQPDVLHLATHASFNGRSDRAFIVANGEAIRISELRDLIALNRARGEPLDLLVLSACETAVGDDEASMGLAGAAVQAGALSAIASLWQVDDIGTAELMRQFYSRYRSGRSRSEALREAQLALIEAGGSNARPNIWAAFTLLGAWR
jgi:CHAT domain-containing protein